MSRSRSNCRMTGSSPTRTAAHGVDAGNGTERSLQRRRHGDAMTSGLARQARLHDDHREVHLRQGRHWQQAEADTAQQHDRQAQEHGGNRALDERTGEVHRPQSPASRRTPVGVSLLAIAVCLLTLILDVPTLSRAGSLLQVLCSVIPPLFGVGIGFAKRRPDGRNTGRSPVW